MGKTKGQQHNVGAADLGLLTLRLAVGGLLAGHGAQKLFGWFGGGGLEGTGGFLESLGYRPGKEWALLAGLSEFGGGTLMALGLLHPVGPISSIGAMTVATLSVHAGKPIWSSQGGAELPIVNISAATALALLGPGAFSLDHALGIHVPKGLALLAALAVAGGVVVAETRPMPLPEQAGGATDAAQSDTAAEAQAS